MVSLRDARPAISVARCWSALMIKVQDTGAEALYWSSELETKPWLDLERWQLERLGRFAVQLREQSPFFRDHLAGNDVDGFSRNPSPEAFASLPFVTKAALRDAQADASPDTPFGQNQCAPLDAIVQLLSSSGTTSSPLYYALTRRDAENWADGIAQVFYTAGIRPTDIIAHLVALPMVAGGLPYADGLRRVGATLAWLGGYSTERIIESIPKLHVSAVLATTSFGLHLADRRNENGANAASRLGVQKYLSGGEPGLGEPEIRKKVSTAWNLSHIREMMGLGDVMSAMWAECEDESGMHFNAQRYVYVELVDQETDERVPWTEGARGEAVYTTFDRDAMPVLRYRSADHFVVLGMSCRCGRTSPKVRCIGRTDDMLIYKGMNVFPSAIRELILTRFSDVVEPYIRIWKDKKEQVRFDDPIPVDVEHRRDLEPKRMAAIADAIAVEIRSHFQVRVSITLVPPNSIPRATYKTALVQVRSNVRS